MMLQGRLWRPALNRERQAFHLGGNRQSSRRTRTAASSKRPQFAFNAQHPAPMPRRVQRSTRIDQVEIDT